MTKSERETIFAALLILGPSTAFSFLSIGLLFISISVFVLVAGMILQNVLGGRLPISLRRQWQIVIAMFAVSIILDTFRILKLL